VRTGVLIFCALVLISSLLFLFLSWYRARRDNPPELLEFWESGSYGEVFDRSGELLKTRPLDYQYLTIHGYAAYQLAIAQINRVNTLSFIDDCIWALRKALIIGKDRVEGGLFYVLGKAYYYKGQGYQDLAVTYLEKAKDLAYPARDIPEYLGLAYTAIREYHASVGAFQEALAGMEAEPGEEDASPSDLLLLSIAKSYLALDEKEEAKAYLIRCAGSSRDSRTINAARLLLGNLLAESGDSGGSEKLYLEILKDDPENADAWYRLGELYASLGEPARARAQWRQAVRINPAHREARARLNM